VRGFEASAGPSVPLIIEGDDPYALVRHPMYAGALVMLVGIPLALGSWWGLFVLLLILPVLIWRSHSCQYPIPAHIAAKAAQRVTLAKAALMRIAARGRGCPWLRVGT
jgi:Phospholipid methyltransferase